ncbi:hypothetical protein [Geobacter metallireducens]|uniref:hypothetical protein n=1 Tax=Geobacter metallireducens TaxID=28232 RepID=UPI00059C587F|nr:hypothetical protein [Geobacter metallireducens]
MKNRVLEMDIRDLPMPVKITGRNGKSKLYLLKPSEKTQGAWLCGIEEPVQQIMQESLNRR